MQYDFCDSGVDVTVSREGDTAQLLRYTKASCCYDPRAVSEKLKTACADGPSKACHDVARYELDGLPIGCLKKTDPSIIKNVCESSDDFADLCCPIDTGYCPTAAPARGK